FFGLLWSEEATPLQLAHPVGLPDTASDRIVRCQHRTTLSDAGVGQHLSDDFQLIGWKSLKTLERLQDGRTIVVARHGIEHVVRFHVEETSRTTLFDTGSDRIIQSHVGQDGRTGFSNIALDNAVQCRVGQAHRMVFVAMLRT
ncbi:hypothetical protein PCANC_20851, partial [Puccinia coronata f. sp. avenae]